MDPKSKEKILSLESEIKSCKGCNLADIPGESPILFDSSEVPNPIMLVGRNPGADEVKEGHPFVGRAGQLLDKMLSAIPITRKSLWITNLCKCHTLDNSEPFSEEVIACIKYLRSEIELVSPQLIVCFGQQVVDYLLGSSYKVSRDHGCIINKNGIPYLIMYHPGFILRSPLTWPVYQDDFTQIAKWISRSQNAEASFHHKLPIDSKPNH